MASKIIFSLSASTAIFVIGCAECSPEVDATKNNNSVTATTAANNSNTLPDGVSSCVLLVSGMTWNSCVSSVRSALTEVAGVRSAKVDLKKGEAIVTFHSEEISSEKLANIVTESGFQSSVKKKDSKGGK